MGSFPWLPLMAIMGSLVTLAAVNYSLKSYAGFMVANLGVVDSKNEAGYFVGLLSTSYMVGRFASAYLWGLFADRYGRLPVMYIGLSSTAVLSLAFGVSTTFWFACLCRFMTGLLNGTLAVAITMVPEVCGPEYEILGMGVTTTSWSIGLIIGPGIGGVLAEPATYYPQYFSESGVFGRYPYLLPNVVVGALALLSLLLTKFFLKETLRVESVRSSFPDPIDVPSKRGTPRSETWPESPRFWSNSRHGQTPKQRHRRRSSTSSLGFTTPSTDTAAKRCWSDLDVGRSRDDSGGLPSTYGHTTQSHDTRSRAAGNECLKLVLQVKPPPPDVEAGGMERVRGHEKAAGVAATAIARCCGRFPPCCRHGSLLKDPHILLLVFIYGLFSFIHSGFDEVLPLWALSETAEGGFDWTSQTIGTMMLWVGVGMLLFEVFAVPCITNRIGISTSNRLSTTAMMLIYLAFPMLPRLRIDDDGLFRGVFVIMLLSALACTNATHLSIATTINNSTDQSHRGELNGISVTVGSLAKAAGPAVYSVIFAASIDADNHWSAPFDFRLAFILMALGLCVVAILSWKSIVVNGLGGYDRDDDVVSVTGSSAGPIDKDGDGRGIHSGDATTGRAETAVKEG